MAVTWGPEMIKGPVEMVKIGDGEYELHLLDNQQISQLRKCFKKYGEGGPSDFYNQVNMLVDLHHIVLSGHYPELTKERIKELLDGPTAEKVLVKVTNLMCAQLDDALLRWEPKTSHD